MLKRRNYSPLQNLIKIRRCALAWSLGILLPISGLADNNVESKLKTAYLVNIANFVSWPETPQEIVLCTSGKAKIYKQLSKLSAVTLGNGSRLKVKFDPDSLGVCHILYLDAAAHSLDAWDIPTPPPTNLLIVSDLPDALKNGYAIQFYLRNLKLRFAVNTETLNKADYKISSKLLRLSRKID